jgi:hypothetical protein
VSKDDKAEGDRLQKLAKEIDPEAGSDAWIVF